MIEEAAIRTNPIIYRYLLKSVTMGLSYEEIEYDRKYGRIPMCRSDFYGYRRLFFHYLDKFNMEHKINKVSFNMVVLTNGYSSSIYKKYSQHIRLQGVTDRQSYVLGVQIWVPE